MFAGLIDIGTPQIPQNNNRRDSETKKESEAVKKEEALLMRTGSYHERERERLAHCSFGGPPVSYHERIGSHERPPISITRERVQPLSSAFVFGERQLVDEPLSPSGSGGRHSVDSVRSSRERNGRMSPTTVAVEGRQGDFSSMHNSSSSGVRGMASMGMTLCSFDGQRPSHIDVGGLPSSIGRTSPSLSAQGSPGGGRVSPLGPLGMSMRRAASEENMFQLSVDERSPTTVLPWHAQASITLAGSVAAGKVRKILFASVITLVHVGSGG